jgi:hypothetical protein
LAPSSGRRFEEEAEDRVVLEEVALVHPDQRWLAWKCVALQCGGTAEQGTAFRSNCEQGCEREESRSSFSGSSSVRIRRRSRGGVDDCGIWCLRRGNAGLIGAAMVHVGRQRQCRARSEEGKKWLGFSDSQWAAVDKDGKCTWVDGHRWRMVTVRGVAHARVGDRCVQLSGGSD